MKDIHKLLLSLFFFNVYAQRKQSDKTAVGLIIPEKPGTAEHVVTFSLHIEMQECLKGHFHLSYDIEYFSSHQGSSSSKVYSSSIRSNSQISIFGRCQNSTDNPFIDLKWNDGEEMSLLMYFSKHHGLTGDTWSVSEIEFNYILKNDPFIFPAEVGNETSKIVKNLWKTPIGQSYECDSVTNVILLPPGSNSKTYLRFTNLRLQPFQIIDNEFSPSIHCTADKMPPVKTMTTNAPLIVAAILAGMVLVMTACYYLFHTIRSKINYAQFTNTSYEGM